MYKELIISIVIIAIIVASDILTTKYLNRSTDNMRESLYNVEKAILENNKNDIDTSMHNLQVLWESNHKKLSYFVEHDELEKVKVRISNMSGNKKVEEYKQMVQYIEECTYILEHIKEKESLLLENIF